MLVPGVIGTSFDEGGKSFTITVFPLTNTCPISSSVRAFYRWIVATSSITYLILHNDYEGLDCLHHLVVQQHLKYPHVK